MAVAEAVYLGPVFAQAEELQNDGWSSGQGAAFQGGFVTGEIGAVRLVPTVACPCQVEKVSLLFGGATSTQMVSIQFWDDPGTTNDPGAPIGLPFDVSLTGADDVLHEVTLGDDVIVNGPFRVGIEFFHDGPPSIARDSDGTITSDRNFICASFGADCVWFRSSTFGVSGDWVIRATVVPEPGQGGLIAALAIVALLARWRGSTRPGPKRSSTDSMRASAIPPAPEPRQQLLARAGSPSSPPDRHGEARNAKRRDTVERHQRERKQLGQGTPLSWPVRIA